MMFSASHFTLFMEEVTLMNFKFNMLKYIVYSGVSFDDFLAAGLQPNNRDYRASFQKDQLSGRTNTECARRE